MEELVLTARWIFPATSAPLERGTITICNDLISSVAARGARAADIDLGDVAVIPGLVNAHTHLDLTGLRGQVPPSPDFTSWLKTIIGHRRQQTNEQMAADANAGLAEAFRFGTTLIGDIAAGGATWPILSDASCWSVVFYEILCLHHRRVMNSWSDAVRWLDLHPDGKSCRAGLSPHASYSVHESLFRAAGLAGVPLTIHLAESADEKPLLEEHRGPFVEFLHELGVWDEDGLAPSLDWIVWRGGRAPSLLLAHGNYLDPAIQLPSHATIVYCPRTHAAFGHPPHLFRELLARGVRVALGTDSLASNPDLDILAEAQFIYERHPDVPGEKLLRMATLAGAEALGLDRWTGSLEAGKSADLVAVPIKDVDAAEPYFLLFQADGAAVAPRRTMWRGRWR